MPLPTKDARDIFERSEEIRKMDMMSGGYLKDGTPTELTRLERAKALGFRVDEPVYHGTRQDLRRFDNEMIGTETDEGFLGEVIILQEHREKQALMDRMSKNIILEASY